MDGITARIQADWDGIADSDWYASYRTAEEIGKIIDDPASAFHPGVWALLRAQVGELKGKRVLVPSSGDNHAAFAFHLMGADVTSADISPRQIAHAEAIAAAHGWAMTFAVENSMTLAGMADGAYDLVYTSNGALVWIHDLPGMFGQIRRVLRPGGRYVLYDIHPFARPFADGDPADKTSWAIEKPYDAVGPLHGGVNWHWRMQDILNALMGAGFSLRQIEELYAEFGTYWFESSGGRQGLSEEALRGLYDWRVNPLAALPQWLAVCGEK